MKYQVALVIGILFIPNFALARYDQCGKRKAVMKVKIIDGNISYPGMWPWQIGIKEEADDLGNWETVCGGALIAPQWVLTAAHCFYTKIPSGKTWVAGRSTKQFNKYKIIAGDHYTNIHEHTEQATIPLEIHIHPDYRYYPNSENDIALIKLSKTFTLGPNVRTICLPKGDFAKPGSFGTAAGWGVTGSGMTSPVLRYSRLKIQDNRLCNQTTKFGFKESVMFCAGDGKGHSDTCSGDSGGSVVRRLLVNGQYRWVTIGIVSWGEGCAVPGKYGYYTRLHHFVEWINQKTNSLCIDPGPPRNGLRAPDKRLHRRNDKVAYHCNAGYTRIGMPSLTCDVDGKWDVQKPLCLAPCSDPGVPGRGVRMDDDFKHGKSVRFRCNHGYELIGKSLITCDNGRWDSNSPRCNVPCDDIGHPVNGLRKPDKKNFFEETVTFECHKNYKLLGKSSLYCDSHGKWNGSRPLCLAPCPVLNLTKNSAISLGNNYQHGQVVRFRCKKGHQMIGTSFMTCINGRWTSIPPKCLAPCSNPGVPFNGERLDHSFLHGDTVRFKCRERYAIQGKQSITCENGRWNNDTPMCLECDSPLGMENGKIPDANIKASSYKSRYRSPRFGRLHGSRAWCSRNRLLPYLEVDLGKPYRITSLATQGSARDGKWVKKFVVGHTLARSSLIDYREDHQEKIFTGNKDAKSVVKHILKNPFIARKVRFSVINVNRHKTCLRVEIYGCDLPKDCIMVGSRVLGRWGSSYWGGDYYYKAYVKTIDGNDVQLELENEKLHDTIFKTMSKISIVLDDPPNIHELRIGTTVLALKNNRYYPGRIIRKSGNHYIVSSFGSQWFSIDQLRLPRNERFCE